jgi:prepilin-type N-terminal cleavage/methylation domain-containing protein
MARSATRGMSIVELMIVVVIIGILAAISVVSYRRYIARARMSEPTALLAEFAAKEQLYYLDAGQYLEAHRNSSSPMTEDAGQFYPSDPASYFDSVRTPVALGTLPDSWKLLGIRPRWQQLYCTYLANAASAGTAPPAGIGATLWATTPTVPWFYILGACNLNGEAGWPNNVTVLSITHDSPAIRTKDETN